MIFGYRGGRMLATNGTQRLFERTGGDGGGGAAAAAGAVLRARSVHRRRGPSRRVRPARLARRGLRVARSSVRSLAAA